MAKATAGSMTARAFLVGCALLLSALAVNCNEHAQPVPAQTQPQERPAKPAAAPATSSAAAEPAPEATPKPLPPETQPEPALPESTYDSKPPYPVSLFVKSPDDKQPGWLKIEKLADDKQIATAAGKFPEHNRIYVDTGNVRRIRIHVTHLPLRANERVILQIDGQGMVLSRNRPFTTLELSPTGEWVILKEK